MTMPSDPLSRPLIEIARDLRERRASARELIEAAIARHEHFGERLHAYLFWAPEQARAVARAADAAFSAGVSAGPLQGDLKTSESETRSGSGCFGAFRLPLRNGSRVRKTRRHCSILRVANDV
jgi:hypothetical protein